MIDPLLRPQRMHVSTANPYETATGAAPVVSRRTVAIKRIDVLSCGVMMAILYAILGLFAGAVFSLLAILGAIATNEGMAGVVGIFAIIVMPIGYGIGGFIVGCIGALIYNVCASIVGGIKLDLE